MGGLRIRLLGELDVDGVDRHQLGSRKSRTLVKVLAAARLAPVSVDRLVDVLWPDKLPAKPSEQVQVLVSRLRSVLGADRIVRTDAGYTLLYDWLDVAELESRTDEAAARFAAGRFAAARAAAAAALQLGRGPLLIDEDGDWATSERLSTERTVARARLIGAESALVAGAATDAAALADAALDHDPYDERAVRLLMRAHCAAGRPASALAAYARARHLLADQLGVDPAPETIALHTSILRGELVEAPPTVVTPTLVGRDHELAVLDEELDLAAAAAAAAEAVDSRSVVVEGEAGIGKTALVTVWAERVAATALVMRVRCDELGHDLPLQPVLDGIAALLRDLGPELADEVAARHDSVLGPLLGRAPVATSDGPTTVADAATGQSRLFAAMLDIGIRAAAGRPIVMLVEDLHVAGSSTAAWLRFALSHADRLLVVATRRPGFGGPSLPARSVALPPLDISATAELVGDERSVTLHARSGGNPLLLLLLASAAGDEIPPSVVDAVRGRVEALGRPASTLRTASVLGIDVDVDLLAACVRRPLVNVLDDLERGVAAGLLVEHGAGFAFAHDLVRDALAADVSAARRAFVHREASRLLRTRATNPPLETAFHAREGGEAGLAATALVEGAEMAAARYDLDVAEQLLSRAIDLGDHPAARLARARVRMARAGHDAAAADVDTLVGPGAGPGVYELAGWIAYYRRDFAMSRRFADEAARIGGDPGLRSSALALGGRIRHSRGALADAAAHLEEAIESGPGEVRVMAEIWLSGVRVHEGKIDEALALTDGLHDDTPLPHPFALQHGLFTRCMGHGIAGRVARAFASLAELDTTTRRLGAQGRRLAGPAANLRGWLLRSVGDVDAADEANREGLALAEEAAFAEPHAHARLDLAESLLRRRDLAGAAELIDGVRVSLNDEVTMAWHLHQRLLWQQGRVALGGGDEEQAGALASELIADATNRGTARYEVLGNHLALCSGSLPLEEAESVLDRLDAVAGLDAWRLTAELANVGGVDRWWKVAERRAAHLLDAANGAPGVDREAMGRWLDRELSALHA